MYMTWIQWCLQIKMFSADESNDKDTKNIYTVILSLERS
jgi:hypothetical protein